MAWLRREDGDDSECGNLVWDRWEKAPFWLVSLDAEAANRTPFLTTCLVILDSQIRPESEEAAELQTEPLPAPWACQPLICSCSYKYLQIPAAEEQDILRQLGLPGWKLMGGLWQARTTGGRVRLLGRDRCSGLPSSASNLAKLSPSAPADLEISATALNQEACPTPI